MEAVISPGERGGGGRDDHPGDCCFSQSHDPTPGAPYQFCGGAHTETVISVSAVNISQQSIIDDGSAFDPAGQTRPQRELTGTNNKD